LTLCFYGATSPQKPGAAYDGHWWLSVSTSERSGFLNGYFDCYIYECKGPDRFSSSVVTYRYSITEFYEKGEPFELNDLVSDLLHEFRDPQGYRVIDRYAEHEKGPHGGNDGLYWKQMSALGGKAEQVGFVEGYLWCHAHLSGNKGGTFSKDPVKYVALITRWYGFVAETGDIDAEREPTAIADALFKFRDHPERPKPESK
jgi:hypothetical protein